MRKVEVAIAIKSSPEQIISAFTDQKMLQAWWDVEQSLVEKRIGGFYTLTWNVSDKGFGYVSTGLVKAYQPNKLLIVDNLIYLNPEKPFLGPLTLHIEVEASEDTTQLYLKQEGYQSGEDWDWYYEAVTKAWPIVLESLKDYLEN
ncbi:MAG: SRPBCC domain-containing protein [Bacteroidota bacterium]